MAFASSRVKRLFVLFLALALVCGCTKTVTRSDLDAKATEHARNSFPDRAYYIGSHAGHDYFVIQSGMGGSRHRYRVLQSENAVTGRFELTQDPTLWRGYYPFDESAVKEIATKYRDAYVSGFSAAGSEETASNLAAGTIQSVEKSPAGWHVAFVTKMEQNHNPHEYYLHVYIKDSGELEKTVRGPDK
jgi:hypothetical protein